MSISPASHLKPLLPNWLIHLECLQSKWPWPNFVENRLKCWDVLLGNMAYSQLAPYGKGHLLPSAICKERRLAKWWAAQRAKNMPQTRLEKGENMEMYEETLWNKVKGNWALAKCVDLFFPHGRNVFSGGISHPGAEVRRSPQSRSSMEGAAADSPHRGSLLLEKVWLGLGHSVATMSWGNPDLVSIILCGSWLVSSLVNIYLPVNLHTGIWATRNKWSMQV